MKGKDEWSCFRTSRQVEIASQRKVVDEPTRSTTKFVFIRLPAESSSSCTRFLWRMAVPVVLVGKIISSPCEPQRQGWRERRQSVSLLSRHVSLVWDLHWENNCAFQYLRAYKHTHTHTYTHRVISFMEILRAIVRDRKFIFRWEVKRRDTTSRRLTLPAKKLSATELCFLEGDSKRICVYSFLVY